MPSFDTPEPITVNLQLDIGTVEIVAGDRGDTVVDVRPSSTSSASDQKAADETQVSYSRGKLLIKAPKQRSSFRKGGSIHVQIGVPTGSAVHGKSSMADLSCEGRIGECRFKTQHGDIQIDESGPLAVTTTHGDVVVRRAVGRSEITGCGSVRIGEIDGPAVINNTNGETNAADVTGNLRVTSTNGAITVGRAHADVRAETAVGSIRLDEVMRGTVELESSVGALDIGVRHGTAALLETRTLSGSVNNRLDSLRPAENLRKSDDIVQVHAGTGVGNITVRRV
ncbi:DUF4097 family beta strand repeat-containing protein [Streptomyces sp. NPDC051217]|uniref:DUF4097 family beta strand repeat-containing protein n=1 Tax=Streptomyces sp. NPDC051217 TaxID=3365644 RepID=UPI0037970C2B